MKHFLLFFFVVLASVPSVEAFQTTPDESNPFTVIYDEGPIEVDPGDKISVEVTIQIPDDHYLYEEMFELNLEENGGFDLGEIKKLPGEKKNDPFFGRIVDVYYRQALITIPVTIPKETWAGEKVITGDIQYQGCSDELCYRLMHTPFSTAFKVKEEHLSVLTGKGPRQTFSFWDKIDALISGGNFDEIIKEGFWFALLLAFIGGMLTDLTPCVWPMIPITLAHLGVRKGKSWFQNMVAVFFLMLGMAVMYSLLGVAAALLGKGLGFFFQSIGFLVLLNIVLFAMAFSFLGLFEIRFPSSFLTRISKISAHGYPGDFLVGLTMGIIAAPCVGPVMGPLLAFVAQTKDVVAGFWLLLFYAFGMSSLFFVIAALHGSVPKRFRGGPWLLWFERLLGIVILLVGLYYARILYSEIRGAQPRAETDFWIENLETGLAKAASEEKPILIDFYAEWCAPCQELKRQVWNNSAVSEDLRGNWVAIHIDCTQETNECKTAVDQFKVVGWPTILFLDKAQKEIKKERLVGKVIGPDEMLETLKKLEK